LAIAQEAGQEQVQRDVSPLAALRYVANSLASALQLCLGNSVATVIQLAQRNVWQIEQLQNPRLLGTGHCAVSVNAFSYEEAGS
jgi:hypothetical protein